MSAPYAKPIAGIIYTVFADPGRSWMDLGDTIFNNPWVSVLRKWKWVG